MNQSKPEADQAAGTPATAALTQPLSSSDEFAAGDRVGRYEILARLGEGGFAIVYLAQQDEPVRRRVALKINRPGMDSGQFLARFEAERQALALMDHPNVAKVYDAGATEAGRTYLVMEYVPGEPITAFCDRHTLGTDDRLALFLQACAGVQHAHQVGIIHRDVKPSNVLVSVRSGAPLVKIIDFGVVKAIGPRLTDKTIFTEFGQLIGTPEYMSPEQAEMSVLDVDTRSDIYSLGVLLYELLVGALPFDPKSLRHAAYGEIRRIIREEDPPKPSTRLSTLGEQLDRIASKHHASGRALERELRGDLDWITMRAMEKDRTRRYASASEFAADIERHMRHEPVIAGPPGAWYRVGKFARKNRVGAIAAAVVLLGALAGVGGIVVGAVNARTQRDDALAARALADLEGRRHEAVAAFLGEIFYSFSRDEARRDVTVAEILQNAALRLDAAPPAEPAVEASVRQVIGTAYANLGLPARAEPHLRRASALLHAPDSSADASDVNAVDLALARCLAAQQELDEAERLLRAMRRDADLAADARPGHRQAVLHELGVLMNLRERFDEAEALCREAYEAARTLHGEHAPATFAAMEALCLALHGQGRAEEYEALSDRLWTSLETLPAETRQTVRLELESLQTLVRLFLGDGDVGLHSAAIVERGRGWTDQQAMKLASLLAPQLEAQRELLGPDHERTRAIQWTLALAYDRGRRYDLAEPVWREYLAGGTESTVDADRIAAINGLALACRLRGASDEALEHYARASELIRDHGVLDADVCVDTLLGYARLLRSRDQIDEAEETLLTCHEIIRTMAHESSPARMLVLMELESLYSDRGDDEKAAHYRQERESQREK